MSYERDRIIPLSSQEAARMLKEAAGIMARARASLKHYAGKYSESAYAKEARLVMEEIDEWSLRL